MPTDKLLIPIDQIDPSPALAVRAEVRRETVAEYAELIRQDVDLGDPVVFRERLPGGEVKYWLGDGVHRLEAHVEAEFAGCLCVIKEGDEDAAFLYAQGANAKHGIRLSNADKREKVRNYLLRHLDRDGQEWARRVDAWIASDCHVTQPFVGIVRGELERDGIIKAFYDRLTRDGRTVKTENIGRGRKSEAEASVALDGETHTVAPTGTLVAVPARVLDAPRSGPLTDPPDDEDDGESPADGAEARAEPQWAETDEDRGPVLSDADWEGDDAPPAKRGLGDSQRAVNAVIRKLGAIKSEVAELAESDPVVGAWLDPMQLDDFGRRIGNAQALLKDRKPHAPCGYCGGAGCGTCKRTGFLPYAMAQAAPQPEAAR